MGTPARCRCAPGSRSATRSRHVVCLGTLVALHHRDAVRAGPGGDSAIYEAVARMMESLIRSGRSRPTARADRRGAANVAPSNVYPTGDGDVCVRPRTPCSAGWQAAMGQPGLAADRGSPPTGGGAAIDRAGQPDAEWTATLAAGDLLARLHEAGPGRADFRARDMLADPHFAARRRSSRWPAPGLRAAADAERRAQSCPSPARCGPVRRPRLGEHNDTSGRPARLSRRASQGCAQPPSSDHSTT